MMMMMMMMITPTTRICYTALAALHYLETAFD